MRGSNQGGSLAGFIVIGAFLVLVLAGGLYGLNRYNTEQQKKQEIAQQEEEQQPSSTDKKETAPESKSGASSSSTDNSADKGKSSANSGGSASQSGGQSTANQSGTDQLPQTGPADGLLNVIAITLLSFAVVSYLQSRTYVRQRSLR